MRIRTVAKFATYLLLPLVAGCATTRLLADKTLLDFLEEGKTSRQMVMLKLGQPSGNFEGERIVTYRLGSGKNGYFLLAGAGSWAGTKFSLVLIFDENNVLQKHSMVQVR